MLTRRLLPFCADGRYILFSSDPRDLVDGCTGTPGLVQVYLRDMQTDTTRLVSAAAGTTTTGAGGTPVALSRDGRRVLFLSQSASLVPGVTDANGAPDVFVWDAATGTTRLVSSAAGHPDQAAAGASEAPRMSADGRYVASVSDAHDVVPGLVAPDWTGHVIYWRDLEAAGDATQLVSGQLGSATDGANAGVRTGFGALSADGSRVVFSTAATDIVAGFVDHGTDGGDTSYAFLGARGGRAAIRDFGPIRAARVKVVAEARDGTRGHAVTGGARAPAPHPQPALAGELLMTRTRPASAAGRSLARVDPVIELARVPRRPPRVDLAIAGALSVWALLEALFSHGPGSPVARVVTGLAFTVPLVFRRRWPVPILVVIGAVVLLRGGTSAVHEQGAMPFPALLVATFSAALYARPPWLAIAAAPLPIAVMVAALLTGYFSGSPGPVDLAILSFISLGAWAGGWLVRRRARQAQLARAAAPELGREAVLAERARMARELHDIIAHSLSIIAVQAGAAEELVDDDHVVRPSWRPCARWRARRWSSFAASLASCARTIRCTPPSRGSLASTTW